MSNFTRYATGLRNIYISVCNLTVMNVMTKCLILDTKAQALETFIFLYIISQS